MNEEQSRQIAEILGGEAWQSGGDIWLVLIRRQNGGLVVLSDDVVTEYASEEDFENSEVRNYIVIGRTAV